MRVLGLFNAAKGEWELVFVTPVKTFSVHMPLSDKGIKLLDWSILAEDIEQVINGIYRDRT